MSLKGFVDKIGKRSLVEGSAQNLPVAQGNESLVEVVDRYVDPRYARQMSILSAEERVLLGILDAYNVCEDDTDIDGFLSAITENLFLLSSSVGGARSNLIQNISVGQMNREFAEELARIRAGGVENSELKDVK